MTKYAQKASGWWQDCKVQASRRGHFSIHRFASVPSRHEKRQTTDLRRISFAAFSARCIGNLRNTARGISVVASICERAQDLISNPIECCAARILDSGLDVNARQAYPQPAELVVVL